MLLLSFYYFVRECVSINSEHVKLETNITTTRDRRLNIRNILVQQNTNTLRREYDHNLKVTWPLIAATQVERIITYLTIGYSPKSAKSITQIVDNIYGENISSENIFKWRFERGLRQTIFKAFPLVKWIDKHYENDSRKKRNIYDISGSKDDKLAFAVALAEAHNYIWDEYGIQLNQLIVGGKFTRRFEMGKLSPYSIIEALSKIESSKEYLVTALFPKSKFTRQMTYLFLNKHYEDITFKNGAPKLFEILHVKEGSIFISEKNIREYMTLKENGFYDGKPKARIIMVKKQLWTNGKPNFRSIALHSIFELQDKYPKGIPYEEIDKLSRKKILELTKKEYLREMFNLVTFEYEKETVNNSEGIIGKVRNGKFYLTKRIALIEDCSLKKYPIIARDSKILPVSLQFRKNIIEYYLKHKEQNGFEVPVSIAKGIYRKIMEERGEYYPDMKITERTKGLCNSFICKGQRYPSIVITSEQLLRIKNIKSVIGGIITRYQYLSQTENGKRYMEKLFSKSEEYNEEISNSQRRSMIKKLLIEFLS
ncbi:MAG: hypothetical protein WCK31_00290 [bacterium]